MTKYSFKVQREFIITVDVDKKQDAIKKWDNTDDYEEEYVTLNVIKSSLKKEE